MVSLATDQAAKVQDNTLGLIPLTKYGHVSVLKRRQLLFVAFPLTLKFLGNLLLKDQGLESIITLLLSAREAGCKASCVIFLLVDEASKTSVLALMVLNFDLEILGLFCELLSKCLEFEELRLLVKHGSHPMKRCLLVVSSFRVPRQGSCSSS